MSKPRPGFRRPRSIWTPLDKQFQVRLELSLLEDRTAPATFTVTNTNPNGAGSLEAAIINANSNGVPDLINFNIGGGGPQTITPTSGLPSITEQVTIDATSQPGYAGKPLITL